MCNLPHIVIFLSCATRVLSLQKLRIEPGRARNLMIMVFQLRYIQPLKNVKKKL